MALATRNLYLVLKARDEASRVVRGFGRELARAGSIGQAESFRTRAGLAAQRASYLAMTGASAADVDQQRLLSQSLRRQAQELEQAHRSAVRFSNAMHTVSATLVTVGSGLALAGGAGLVFLKSAVNVAVEYERQVRLTSTQADIFKASLEEFAQVGIRVANSIAVPFEQIQPALYDILSSTNANLKQAEILLTGFSKTAVAGQVTLQEAARGTIPILNAFNIPLEKVNDVLDIQFQLVRKGVGTYGEFSKVFGRVTPSATRAGQSFEMVAAMLAFMTRNGLSAAMASTSAARALEAMSHPRSVAFMEKLGIKVRDAAGNFLPLNKSLKNLRDHLNKLPKKDRVGAIVEIFKGAGGTIQARRFLEQVLLRPGELEEFTGFLKDMENSTGEFGKAYSTMAGGVAAQSELLRNKWKILQETVGRIVTPAFLAIVTALQGMLDWFNKLDPKTKRIIIIVFAVGSALMVLSGIFVIVIGAIAGLTAAITIAGSSFFILTGIVAGIVVGVFALAGAFYFLYQKSEWFRLFVSDISIRLKELWQTAILPAAIAIRDAWEKHMQPALNKLWEVVNTKVMPVLREMFRIFMDHLIPAVKEVGLWIGTILTKAFQYATKVIENVLIPALEKGRKFYYEHKQTIDQMIVVVIWLAKQIAKLAIIIGVVLAAVLTGPIIGIIMGFVAVVLIVINRIIVWIDRIKAIIAWVKTWGDSTKRAGEAVKGAWGNVVNFFRGVPGRIKSALGNLGSLLFSAGKSVIQGLLDGIRSKIPSIDSLVSGAVQRIRDFFPGSPAKRGPLAGAGSMVNAGKEMVKQLGEGMKSMDPVAASASRGTALRASGAALMAPTSGRSVVQNFTIHTQQIDPRRDSAELGFMLSGRV